jgi:hypothetical protein
MAHSPWKGWGNIARHLIHFTSIVFPGVVSKVGASNTVTEGGYGDLWFDLQDYLGRRAAHQCLV